MKTIVQKFGGTSLRTAENRQAAFTHVRKAIDEGYKSVVVVSAMGRVGDPYATDTLLSLVGGSKTHLSDREHDLLLSCGEVISAIVFTELLLEKGIRATALTGAQAGIRTNEDFKNAKIIDMNIHRIIDELKIQDVVVVTGYQGVTENGEVTTIGRGGSDTSAVAVGVALQAEWIDIFTDVDGIMTADPKLTKKARPLKLITYNEVCNLAYQGAKVIHPRAVELANNANIPIRIRSTYSNKIGTLVTTLNKRNESSESIMERQVTGIAHVSNVTQIRVEAKERNQYNLQVEVFKAMANENISVDFINISPNSICYTVLDVFAETAVNTLKLLGYEPIIEKNCAKVSIVGAGITGVPGIASKMVTALSDKGIRILQSADSYTTIWVLVKQHDLVEAVNALHDTFELGKEEIDIVTFDGKVIFEYEKEE